ncbi:MAG: outer membrane protein assembly factor BamD, partial [Candidatus Aminicenantales bacterium]
MKETTGHVGTKALLTAGFIVFLALGPAALSVFPAADPQTEDARKFQAVYSLIMEEQWEEAATALDGFLAAYPRSPWTDDARFWKCYVMGENDSPRATVFKCYQDFIAAYPTSEWADDARKRMIEIAEELADRGKPEYMAIVKAMDKTSDEEVAIAALEALRDVGDDNALDSLLDLYGQSQEGKLRSRIIHVLGEFDNPK